MSPNSLEPDRFELREAPRYRFELNRRELLELAGVGLWISVAIPAVAQRGADSTSSLESRLHIGEDGAVTIFSGKVEEGQGARTEIAMAAAEELRLPLERVVVVLADTRLVPNDGITAGSRTTPATLPAVRRAAAAARSMLVDAAAKTWQTDAAGLEVREGSVHEPTGKRTFSYADLARSPQLASAYKQSLPDDVRLTEPKNWKLLGQPRQRINGRDIVTGKHRFPSDVVRPGMLYGAVMRPPSFGATLVSADLAAAKQSPGVVAVRDGDFAGCAAPTSYAARKAVEAMAAKSQWKAVADAPSSDGLFEYLKANAKSPRVQERGSVGQALKAASRTFKATYHVAYVQHAPMEPRAAVAEWQDGSLTVWTGTSNPFSVREQLAQAFKVPADRVRVVVPDFGGGFGGKHTGEAAIEAARLAKEAGRPVSLRWTRPEEFSWAYARPAALIEVEAGISADRGITAWDFSNYNSGTSALESPYSIANVRTRYITSESPLRQGSYRCLAAVANNFAREAFTDELARTLERDPLEFRLAHLDNERIRNVLTAAAKRFGWAERRSNRKPGRGIGLACGTEKNSVVAACVEVAVDPKTGAPKLLEICEAFECGPILNPAGLRAQVEGAIMMGLGPAVYEELKFSGGQLTNGRFSRYKVPRFQDVPKMDLVFLDRRDLEAAGAGETPIMAIAPAIANAVLDATGQPVRTMPIRRPT